REGSRSLLSADLGELGLDCVVLGGRHDYQEYEIGNTTFVYPGALCGLTYGDWDERFLVFANLDDEVKNIDPRVWDAPPIVEAKFEVASEAVADESSLAAHLAEKFSGVAMARVTLTGTAPYPFDLDVVPQHLPEGAPLFDLIDDTDLSDVMAGSTMQQRFVAQIREKMDGADTATKRKLRHALRIGVARFRELEVSDAA
ncbi:MAG: hypothetical protein HKN21_08650, partial [Candidatus Eisenbacteria bacterium]|nr:hypothetical protein [Candidatus Eisenbacteria bacterium]